MIYLDTSVLLAELLAEDRRPDASIWEQTLASSRLLEYEVWTRLHGYRRGGSHGESARQLLARVSFLELSPVVLERALEPFPVPVRTLDALHLASLLYLRERHQDVTLASFDRTLLAAASALGLRTL